MKALLSFLLSSFVITAVIAAPATDKKFIADWLIGGPYPSYLVNDKDSGLDTDYSAESSVKPYPGLAENVIFKADRAKLIAGIGSTNEWGFDSDHSIQARWQQLSFAKPERIELNGMFAPIDDHFVWFAAVYIESPQTQAVKIALGSDDDHKLYLNGRVIGRAASSQDILPDNFIYDAVLQKGINLLLLKVVDRTGGTGFCLRLTDPSGKEIPDLHYHTDDPRRKFDADQYLNGYAAKFDFPTPISYDDASNPLTVTFFAPDRRQYEVSLKGEKTQLVNGEKYTFRKLKLAEGEQTLTLLVKAEGQTVAELGQTITIFSRQKVEQQTTALRRELEQIRAATKQTNDSLKAREQQVAALRSQLAAAVSRAEERYAQERSGNLSGAAKSTDIPLPGKDTRQILSLNGEWRFGTTPGNIDGTVRLPCKLFNDYFVSWYEPYVRTKDNKNQPRPGWQDYRFDERLCQPKLVFTKEYQVDDPDRTAFFTSENILGKIELYNNAERCGEYSGLIGQVEIPLKNLKKGANTLEIRFEEPQSAFDFKPYDITYGLRGNLAVEFGSPVRVNDVWVKTSWRKSELATETELVNRTSQAVNYTLNQYAVKDGVIRFRLPTKTGVLTPGQTQTLQSSGRWADPELWSLQHPFLYELVSDLSVDGKTVDRKRDAFGFREFWIHGVDFFANGKRVILQGDVGHADWDNTKLCDVAWPLYRADNINLLRIHDSSYWSMEFLRNCDQLGMYAYVQMYPALHHRNQGKHNFTSIEEWLKDPLHQFNLDNYKAWHKMFRNHPSVVIVSTDNEILTQAWDTAADLKFNLRNDKLGAVYEKYVKGLDPSLVLTRDGDVGTWNSKGRWFENPPCDTANYHYPDYNPDIWVKNWVRTYEFRPVIFGETIYCAYGANDWLGANADTVAKQAAKIRKIAKIYREEEIPCAVYMGLGLDGFIQLRADGKGTPWGVPGATVQQVKDYAVKTDRTDLRSYPFCQINWPSPTGRGTRPQTAPIGIEAYGDRALNWFDPNKASHVRNMVNDAYRDTLIPQPPLVAPGDAECIIVTTPGATVWCESADGQRLGIIADGNGRAWFQLPKPGGYVFDDGNVRKELAVPGRADYAGQPGFDKIKLYSLQP